MDTISTIWNGYPRVKRAEMLANMGVDSRTCLETWSACAWEQLPDVARFSLTAQFREVELVKGGAA